MDTEIATSPESQEVIVRESGQGKYSQEVIVGKHIFTADEPIADQGNDLGPSPYDLLLAALGACTSMTLRLYADLKQLPLENIIVKLTHKKIHREDCINCEDNNSKIDHIDRHIKLQGKLSEEQCQKLLEIANKCPVHRTLTTETSITTKLIV